MTADAELLQAAVTEVARLLNADGAMIYLVDEASGELRFAHDAGITNPEARRLIRGLTLPVGVGMFGTAVAARRLTVTDDYPADRRFRHSPVTDRIVVAAGMRSMAVAPLLAGGRPIGAMGAYSSRPAAFSEAQIVLLRALADHAAAAIANQRLMAQLAASEERYRNLVEGSPDVVWATDASGHFTFLSETVEQLTGSRADELLGQHWSVIVAPEDRDTFQQLWRESQRQREDERRARFRVQRRSGPAVTVELRARERLVDGRSAGAHGSMRDITEMARLEQGLRSQAEELAHQVETQQTLHAIAARITAIRDPDEVLQHVVDAAKRLLGSDGAHLTLRDPEAPILRPHVIAGGVDEEARAWLAGEEFPIGGGLNGLAARDGTAVWTRDYLVDPRIPHTEDDQQVAIRMGLRGMAVAPLRAPEGEVFGTLAVSYVEPRDIAADEIELLQGLADVGAIAIANARLYGQLTDSERRYRFLVDNSPDLVWTVDRDGYFTYLSETCEHLIGWRPEELVGTHFSGLIAPESMAVVMEHWQRAIDEPQRRQQYRLNLLHRDGSHLPMEVNALGTLLDGTFAGAHGSVRDIRERVALEVDLRRQADELSRLLEAQRSLSAIAAQITSIRDPPVVLQRTVDEAHRLLRADLALINQLEVGGGRLDWAVAYAPADQPLEDVFVTPGQGVSGTALAEHRVVRTDDYLNDPAFEHTAELDEYVARRGMLSVMAAPLVAGVEPIGTLTVQAARTHAFSDDDAQLLDALAAQAAVAITNARLLEQLQESERRYRHLVDHSPDLVWSVDAEGQFTYLGESLERMTGFRADELLGRHWSALVTEESLPAGQAAWQAVQERPSDDLQFRITLPMAGGGSMAAEVNMVATVVDGRFAGAQGSIRDIRERERLEEDLRRQAGALAAGEERANLARELHDSVTQALFSMGLTARALELLLDRDPEAARRKLTELRELQKDALAEMRTLIFELRPQALETDGLAPALRHHGAAVEGRTGLSVSVEVEHAERLSLDVEEALYRIAQEALHNVVKHANAQRARITLRRVRRDLRLTIEDDGVGFDPEVAPRGHLGLVGMRQRAERIGAELNISRRPGGGSRVLIALPLARVTSGTSPDGGAPAGTGAVGEAAPASAE